MDKRRQRKNEMTKRDRNRRRRNRRLAAACEKAAAMMSRALERGYGMTRVADFNGVSNGAYYMSDEHFRVDLAYSLDDADIVRGVAERLGRAAHRSGIYSTMQLPVRQCSEERRRGSGFGRDVWRRSPLGGVEVSLRSYPSETEANILRSVGFVWNNLLGRWYKGTDDGCPIDRAIRTVAALFNLKETEYQQVRKEGKVN